MIHCTVGVMAYNEEQNIVSLLQSLLAQVTSTCVITEIIVIASGCTDRTVELARSVARQHPLVRVDAHSARAGKAAAINQLIAQARGDVIVLVGADTLLDPGAIEALLTPFADEHIGMTGAQVVPLNDPQTYLGLTVHLLWYVHHIMALRWPKLGELVAFRNIIDAIPEDTATDEVALEALISARGLHLAYAPQAIVYNYGPSSVVDFLRQRRRIFAGHLAMAADYDYVAASVPARRMPGLAMAAARHFSQRLPEVLGAMLLELLARGLGTLDWLGEHRHHIWKPAQSTKQLRQGDPLTLAELRYQGSSEDIVRMGRVLQRLPLNAWRFHWVDAEQRRILFVNQSRHPTEPAVQDQVAFLAERIDAYFPGAIVGHRVIAFEGHQMPPPLPARPLPRPGAIRAGG